MAKVRKSKAMRTLKAATGGPLTFGEAIWAIRKCEETSVAEFAKPLGMLFMRSAQIEPLRFHDTRATFVTWAFRAGKGLGWITDRTGHLSEEMVDRYRRSARQLEDLL
jgi:hypothetical protein